ncbi:hypothetical protein [Brucella anthropi]|uniref:hypothetical protein n=1 Tax=Brucella anthropi TaxID=529 RepID=UPI00140665E6|nr:hypothetical protein [Brucella anthropi]KAB2749181.1 hypothetical protein F9L05_12120 [Brucella anthropi]MDH0368703.1 hypothetical protein [Brucella anthropi]
MQSVPVECFILLLPLNEFARQAVSSKILQSIHKSLIEYRLWIGNSPEVVMSAEFSISIFLVDLETSQIIINKNVLNIYIWLSLIMSERELSWKASLPEFERLDCRSLPLEYDELILVLEGRLSIETV